MKSRASWRTRSATWRCVTAPRNRPRPRLRDRPDRRADRGRDHRRHDRRGHRAGVGVRSRHLLPEVRPRVREAGRHSRRPDHGGGGLRPARHGQRLQDDPEGKRPRRAGVDEQPPQPGQPLRGHQPGGEEPADRGRHARDARIPDRAGAPAHDVAGAVGRRGRAQQERGPHANVDRHERRFASSRRQRRASGHALYDLQRRQRVPHQPCRPTGARWEQQPGHVRAGRRLRDDNGQSVFTHGVRSAWRATRTTISTPRPTN